MEREINHGHQGMFKQPFSFSGRIRRTEYCLTYIIYALSYWNYSLTAEVQV